MNLDARLRQYTAPAFAFAAILTSVLVLSATFFAGKKAMQSSVRKDAEINAYLLRNAVEMYRVEYAALPVRPPLEETVSNGPLMDTLLGLNSQTNPRNVTFAAFREAKTERKFPRGGMQIVNKGSGNSLIDPYASPFHLRFDTDEDGKIAHPNPKAAERWILGSVLVYSAGQDRDPGTWEDNILVW